MNKFVKLFGRTKASIIGMIHVDALPGAPRSRFGMEEIVAKAREEANVYAAAKIDGLMIENMHDLPWLRPDQIGPETAAAMSIVCSAIRSDHPNLPIGVQVLSSANKVALAVAKVAGLNFIRAEGWVFAHIGDEGYTESCAADLTRYRRALSAEDILIFTDIKKKHSSHALTSDCDIKQTAHAAELFLSDGVIVTGTSTGVATDLNELSDVCAAVQRRIPVLVGSGVDIGNVHDYMNANALIIGSHFKRDGLWHESLDQGRIVDFMGRVSQLRAAPP